MKTLNVPGRLLASVVLVAAGILSLGSSRGAVPDQNQEKDAAPNEVGIIIQGGITAGQVLRFNVASLASAHPGGCNLGHPGGCNLELRVFDSQGNLVSSHVFPNLNQANTYLQASFFDLSANQLPAPAFGDGNGRAQLTGIFRVLIPGPHQSVVPGPPVCGFVASGEIFNSVGGQTLVHIDGTPISECH